MHVLVEHRHDTDREVTGDAAYHVMITGFFESTPARRRLLYNRAPEERMLTSRNLVLVLSVILAAVFSPATFAIEVDLANSGFEHVMPGGGIIAWKVDDTATAGTPSVTADDEIRHGGVGSLRLRLDADGAVAVVSDPVDLAVGRLYRLSAWVRASGVQSDPTAHYPTAMPACLTMASFPFTNHSPTVGATRDWTRVETLFIATRKKDHVRLHLGFNGSAHGTVWFDDVSLEEVDDITEYIPLDTVTWAGDAYRYDDRGWIFVHIEGEPYERGYQYGSLLADEIVAYISKLGVLENAADPDAGWQRIRFETDTLFLRKYDDEYLKEMRGIADGAARAGATWEDRPLDLLDIVAINSVVDLGQLHDAMEVTPHALTGESFLATEEELDIEPSRHKCSAFVATGPATRDGQVVFGQIFMWGGYTGVHWNVICDVEPSSGHRLVYHTFPGGIHSGADFYINSAGIVIGETTVSQTPFEPDGTPQSNRIRKAAQYANSIDDVAGFLWQGNNGMYTNDWPIADTKTGEVAIFLLGTHEKMMWRTGDDPAPFGLPGFLWANNNNRDPRVRSEYLAQPDDRPFDLVFTPWNRDIAFNDFYREHAGTIDSTAAVNLWASSPINRAHACDGKITTSEMTRELVFLAHAGKVTLRHKFPTAGWRYLPDLPNAEPHLSLGYSVPSPIFVTEQLHRSRGRHEPNADEPAVDRDLDLGELESLSTFDRRRLWRRTIHPATDAEAWFVSGTAAYWEILHGLDDDPETAAVELEHALSDLNTRFLYTVSRESDLIALEAHRAYDRYGPYRIPRIKGTFALHQLHLLLGNELFLTTMNAVHDELAGTPATTGQLLAAAGHAAGRKLDAFVEQWIARQGLPVLQTEVEVEPTRGKTWKTTITVRQEGRPYHLLTDVEIRTQKNRVRHLVEIDGPRTEIVLTSADRPESVVFNGGRHVPTSLDAFYTWSNFVDDFHHALVVYGTSRQDEANAELARRWQSTVSDAYVEFLPPLVKDSELGSDAAAAHDLMVLGQLTDNSFLSAIADRLPVELGRNHFRWHGQTYAAADDGLILVVPNPYNQDRVLYLILANSALELHWMTSTFHRSLGSWARFKGQEIVETGYHTPPEIGLASPG